MTCGRASACTAWRILARQDPAIHVGRRTLRQRIRRVAAVDHRRDAGRAEHRRCRAASPTAAPTAAASGVGCSDRLEVRGELTRLDGRHLLEVTRVTSFSFAGKGVACAIRASASAS